MPFQISAQWAVLLNMQHLVVQMSSWFLLRIFWGNVLIELHPDYSCLPCRSSKHILKKKLVFSFSSTQQDSIYLPCADHNSLTHSCILGKYLRMHSPAANCNRTAEPSLTSYSRCSCWIRNGLKQREEWMHLCMRQEYNYTVRLPLPVFEFHAL